MQSASPSPRFQLALVPGQVWQRTRGSMTGSSAWTALLIVLLTLAIARSTATAAWVDGIDIVTLVALGGAVLMGLLAVLPVPWPAGLGVGLVAGLVASAYAAGPQLHAMHPGAAMSVSAWGSRILTGAAPGDAPGYALSDDPSFYLYLICVLMWVTGGWLSWCVLRWRRPMLGLVPGAAAFATNLLNVPADQNGYTLAILVLTLALLLWSNYTASIASATRARVRLTGDARWDFWESGLVAMAALIVVAIMLPALSQVDRTTQMASSLFSNWAQLQQRLNHPSISGRGTGASATTGFTTDVKLGGPLTKTRDPVFTYTFTSTSAPARYFRGVNATVTSDGEWRSPAPDPYLTRVEKNTIPDYAETYSEQALTAYTIRMIAPPAHNPDILFYPGTLYRVADRVTVAGQGFLPDNQALDTIDRLTTLPPSLSTGSYNVSVEYSIATQAELESAGTNYPDWLRPYESLPPDGYRDPQVILRIHQLALKITAGLTNQYDKAKAIETYLRDNYRYNLNVTTPPGFDPLDYFLFTSFQGYCEFFASAMGDMLRSLGIPTQLVIGFGPGGFDTATHAYIVRSEDTHTWVESYFPSYGWIQFEPTPDGVYSAISRGPIGTTCLRDSACDPTRTPGGPSPTPGGPPVGAVNEPRGPSDTSGTLISGPGFSFRMPDAGTLTRIAGILLAVLLVLLAAAARYLRPRSVMLVWKRTLVLARLAGAERRSGETPLELGRRLALAFPEASEPVRSLADGFVVSAYAPPDLAGGARASVMEAWSALRPLLLRRLVSRLRRSRA